MPVQKTHLPRPTYRVITGPAPTAAKHSEALENALDVMYRESQKPNKRTLAHLQELIKKYPRIPQFKNYLHAAYTVLGEKQKARDVTRLTVQAHPDYFFGKISLAQDYLNEKNWKAIPDIFGGEVFDLERLYPDRDWFHISEVAAIHSVAGQYYIEKGDSLLAEAYLERMEDIAPDHPVVKQLASKLIFARMAAFTEKHSKEKAIERRVESFPKIQVEATRQAPSFHHPEIANLYRYELDDMPPKVVQNILTLPRTTLLLDLRKCLLDTIQRYDWFYETYAEFNEREQNFHLHALYLLAELGDPSALPDVLNLLRQGKDFLEYWFGEYTQEYLWEPLYRLGRNALRDLKTFMLEENIWSFAKITVAEAVEQIAFHEPARRPEVIEWFRAVYRGFLNQPDNNHLIDSQTISWVTASVVHLRAAELIPEIEALFGRQWILPSVMGDLDKIREDLRKPLNPFYKQPLPQNIAERYSGEHKQRRAKSNEDFGVDIPGLFKSADREMKILNELLGKKDDRSDTLFQNGFPDEDDDEILPSKQPAPAWKNVSRNDLCPCGSGKKFKRCHGK